MRALVRISAALLMAIPVCLALLIVFALEARRTDAPPFEGRASHSLER
jgi:hypothetical protein